MIKFVLIFCLFFSISSSAQQPFWVQTNGPSGYIYNIVENKAGDFFVDGGFRFRSTDHGLSWSPMREIVSGPLIISPSTGSIFTYDGPNPGIYRSFDNGETWDTLLKNSIAQIQTDRNGILYVSGKTDLVFFLSRSTDNGDTWTGIQGNIPDSDFTQCYLRICKNNDLYLAGDKNVYRSTNQGISWAMSPLPREYHGNLQSTSNGFLFVQGISDTLLRSKDNGKTWDIILRKLSDPVVTSNDVIVGLLENFDNPDSNHNIQHLLYSLNYGDTWDTIKIEGAFDLGPRLLATNEDLEGNIYWSTMQRVLKYNTITKSFSNFAVPNGDVLQLFVDKSNRIWTSGPTYSAMSPDSGLNWISPPGIEFQLYQWSKMVEDSSGGVIRAISGSLGRSTDGGNNWIDLNDHVYGAANVMLVSPRGDIFTISEDKYLEASSDLGQTWNKRSKMIEQSILPSDITCDEEGRLYTFTDSSVLFSSDDGFQWQQAPKLSSQILCIATTLKGEVFVGTATSGIFKSTDGGLSWIPFNEFLDTESVFLIAAAANGDIYALTQNHQTLGNAYFLPYHGSRWYVANSGLTYTRYLETLAVAPNGTVYFGTNGMGVWKSNGVLDAVSHDSKINNDLTFQISPNPTTTDATISYTILERSMVKLELCDELGRTVRTIENHLQDSGVHNEIIHFDGFASGVYLLQLSTPAESVLKKIIINR